MNLMEKTIYLPASYVGCIMLFYAVFGFVSGYIWTVQNYARQEKEYLETNNRISNQTLATMADSALNNTLTPYEELDVWYTKLTKAIGGSARDSRIFTTKSRYDVEVRRKIDDAIKTLTDFRRECIHSGERGSSDYADVLFWLASYECRKLDANVDAQQQNYNPVLDMLEEAVDIRPDAKQWLPTDHDFRSLRRNPRFMSLISGS